METQNKTFIKSFLDYLDAFHYFEKILLENLRDGWELNDTSGVQYINFQYRAGLSFERKIEAGVQEELPLG